MTDTQQKKDRREKEKLRARVKELEGLARPLRNFPIHISETFCHHGKPGKGRVVTCPVCKLLEALGD